MPSRARLVYRRGALRRRPCSPLSPVSCLCAAHRPSTRAHLSAARRPVRLPKLGALRHLVGRTRRGGGMRRRRPRLHAAAHPVWRAARVAAAHPEEAR
eukprot:906469-Prymnesium_polylepis.1